MAKGARHRGVRSTRRGRPGARCVRAKDNGPLRGGPGCVSDARGRWTVPPALLARAGIGAWSEMARVGPSLGHWHGPAALVTALRDPYVSDALRARLREQCRQHLLEVGIDCGHILMWDAPDETARVVRAARLGCPLAQRRPERTQTQPRTCDRLVDLDCDLTIALRIRWGRGVFGPRTRRLLTAQHASGVAPPLGKGVADGVAHHLVSERRPGSGGATHGL